MPGSDPLLLYKAHVKSRRGVNCWDSHVLSVNVLRACRTKCFDVWLSEAASRPHPTDITRNSLCSGSEAVGNAGKAGRDIVSGPKCRLVAIDTSEMDKEESRLRRVNRGIQPINRDPRHIIRRITCEAALIWARCFWCTHCRRTAIP